MREPSVRSFQRPHRPERVEGFRGGSHFFGLDDRFVGFVGTSELEALDAGKTDFGKRDFGNTDFGNTNGPPPRQAGGLRVTEERLPLPSTPITARLALSLTSRTVTAGPLAPRAW